MTDTDELLAEAHGWIVGNGPAAGIIRRLASRLRAVEAEREQLQARLTKYEAPNGWRELMSRDAFRVLGDPSVSVGGSDETGWHFPAPPASKKEDQA